MLIALRVLGWTCFGISAAFGLASLPFVFACSCFAGAYHWTIAKHNKIAAGRRALQGDPNDR